MCRWSQGPKRPDLYHTVELSSTWERLFAEISVPYSREQVSDLKRKRPNDQKYATGISKQISAHDGNTVAFLVARLTSFWDVFFSNVPTRVCCDQRALQCNKVAMGRQSSKRPDRNRGYKLVMQMTGTKSVGGRYLQVRDESKQTQDKSI